MLERSLKLIIADVVVAFSGRAPVSLYLPGRYRNFLYPVRDRLSETDRRPAFGGAVSNGAADIFIRVDVKKSLPASEGKLLFVTRHPDDGSENWRLYKTKTGYVYASGLEGKEQVVFIDKTLARAEAVVLPKKKKSAWDPGDLIYDFLQVLLIAYFARRQDGIFAHACGIRDAGGAGYLFCGKSGCGKSTTARIWHRESGASVLNDDRVIVRKKDGEFFIYGTPWHGDFCDYLARQAAPAPLECLFFIHHARDNRCRRISPQESFKRLYPAIFPAFWERAALSRIASFCDDLVKKCVCMEMGFRKDKKIIDFVRSRVKG